MTRMGLPGAPAPRTPCSPSRELEPPGQGTRTHMPQLRVPMLQQESKEIIKYNRKYLLNTKEGSKQINKKACLQIKRTCI